MFLIWWCLRLETLVFWFVFFCRLAGWIGFVRGYKCFCSGFDTISDKGVMKITVIQHFRFKKKLKPRKIPHNSSKSIHKTHFQNLNLRKPWENKNDHKPTAKGQKKSKPNLPTENLPGQEKKRLAKNSLKTTTGCFLPHQKKTSKTSNVPPCRKKKETCFYRNIRSIQNQSITKKKQSEKKHTLNDPTRPGPRVRRSRCRGFGCHQMRRSAPCYMRSSKESWFSALVFVWCLFCCCFF